ncbi:hypothetical protein LJC15_06035 [Desulfovibrio sp. OttesenSCG-928-G11]|nr:hypothetical protein [Desulfovibrio sp. OttesenSCG-928-G11]
MPALRTLTFISGHYYHSSRRAGFHNLADAAHRLGFRVNFITAGYSLLSYLRRDYRTRAPGIRGNLNRAVEARPAFISYVYFTAWHPMTLLIPALNRLSMKLMDRYGQGNLGELLPLVQATDIFIFESMSGLFLFERFRREKPEAKYIYRVSDDIRILGSTHPRLVELEREIVSSFDCVSVPSSWMLGLFPDLPSLRLDRHGLDCSGYDACTASPYEAGTKNAVFVGTGYLDLDFLRFAATAHPNCRFHIIGPMADTLRLPNIHFYGEMPFAETLPYIKFADIGLGIRTFRKGYAASLTDSLKIIQYRYCGLPIISPDFLDLQRDGVVYYRPGDAASCAAALKEALALGCDASRAQEVRSWEDVMQDILNTL